ncbi:MAG: helix-turn-helix transcriptional regulator [Methylovulum sp.]|nr:helix-turn-helix transcriptional regulator [Methylovulum sp.]
MKVHEKIKVLRQSQGWTQEETATKLGMSANGYGLIERGKTNVDLLRLEQIAELFGIDLAELCDLSEKNVINLITNTHNSQTHCTIGAAVYENSQLKTEIEKQQLINEQQAQEILYLRGLVDCLLKKENQEKMNRQQASHLVNPE